MAVGVSSRFYDEISRHLQLRQRRDGMSGEGEDGRVRMAGVRDGRCGRVSVCEGVKSM